MVVVVVVVGLVVVVLGDESDQLDSPYEACLPTTSSSSHLCEDYDSATKTNERGKKKEEEKKKKERKVVKLVF